MGESRVDFFISYAGPERAWAEWVAWQLAHAGYTIELDVWDWAAGKNVVTAMSDALDRCDRVVALFSAAYFERGRYTTEEWTAALVHISDRMGIRLVPVRVEAISDALIPGLLRPLVSADLYGMEADAARERLLAAVAGSRRPGAEPTFPGRGVPGGLAREDGGPRLPGSLPQVWNLPARNPGFTGRGELLARVREMLADGGRVAVHALRGMGGVGKTQLAAEYAHRFAGFYELAWWLDAEHSGLIGDQFASLGLALGCVEAEMGAEAVRAAVLAELRQRDRWLLVFDNAQASTDVGQWLPGGAGHVLITTREPGWAEIARPVDVDVLDRPESLALLRGRVPGITTADADGLAARLGDLPLAIAQAAGFMTESGMPSAEYLELLADRARELLSRGTPGSYPRSLAIVTELIIDQLGAADPAGVELATLCAFMAPAPIPAGLFASAADTLPQKLAARARDPLAWRQTLAQLTRQWLVRVDDRGLVMHRLTQAIIRDRLPPARAAAARHRAQTLLAASHPGDPADPANWPGWAQIMPHLLAAGLSPDSRELARYACWYLLARGDADTAYDLASDMYRQWRQQLGPDDPDTLSAAHYLTGALRRMGRFGDARSLDENTLAREQRLLGDDHPSALASANNLAIDLRELGEVRAARELDQDSLYGYRRVLGQDHPDTLDAANNLAIDLRELGEVRAARELDQDTLERRRRVLGQDHPSTLASANNLAIDLHQLREIQAAQELALDNLERCRRVLGQDHPSTLASARNLAMYLRELGEVQAARELDQDTLEHRRRVLGRGHPDTLATARDLLIDLYQLGEIQAVRELAADTLDDRRSLSRDGGSAMYPVTSIAADLRASLRWPDDIERRIEASQPRRRRRRR
jgi:hypothetical protein